MIKIMKLLQSNKEGNSLTYTPESFHVRFPVSVKSKQWPTLLSLLGLLWLRPLSQDVLPLQLPVKDTPTSGNLGRTLPENGLQTNAQTFSTVFGASCLHALQTTFT